MEREEDRLEKDPATGAGSDTVTTGSADVKKDAVTKRRDANAFWLGGVAAICIIGAAIGAVLGVKGHRDSDGEPFYSWQLIKKPSAGDPASQFALGQCYHYAYGIEQDYEKAKDWYKKAANLGITAAQCRLGDYYYEKGETWGDYLEAFSWFEKAAMRGVFYAQFSVGYMYEHGIGVEKNLEEAEKWYHMTDEELRAEKQDMFRNHKF